MPYTFDCSACGAELNLPTAVAGDRRLNCPQCGGALDERTAAAGPVPESQVNPYASPLQSSEPPPEDLDDPRVRMLAKRFVKEYRDRTTSQQLLITGIIGCFSPILAVYGTIFLLMRPYRFPGKRMAIAGTVLHWVWSALIVAFFVLGSFG